MSVNDLVVYNQNVICEDNTTNTNVVHYNLWYPNVYTSCPTNDPNHTWQESIVLAKVTNSNVMIVNNSINTNGNYRRQEFRMDIPAGPDSEIKVAYSMTFMYNVRIVNCAFHPTADNVNDRFSLYIVPPTPVGTVTTAVSSGNNVLMTNTAITALKVGMEVVLDDGVNTQNLGECLAINYNTQTVTTENAVANSFAPGTFVIIKVPVGKNITVLDTYSISFGTAMPGNKFLQEGYIIELNYMNLTANPKIAYFRADLMI